MLMIQGRDRFTGRVFSRSSLVQAKQLRQPLAVGQEDRGLLAARRDHWHDGNPRFERQSDESLPVREVDPIPLPGRSVHLPVTPG
jgi:hypothetical protein